MTFSAGRRASRHTSLTTAWKWLLTAELAVILMCASDLVARQWPGRSADYGWCLTAILLLCPPVAVLGARQPGVRVWTFFILLPMVLVLSWPVWTLLLQGSELRGLELETPTVIGFGVVLVMGGGNYLGTRFALSSVCWMLGTFDLFLTCTGWKALPELFEQIGRTVGVVLLESAVLIAVLQRPCRNRRHPVNRMWDDFRDLFGIVWGLRMVERINALAVQQGWTIRMNFSGFPETDAGRLPANEAEVAAAFRWLFRRFVDDRWVNEYLGEEPAGDASGQAAALAQGVRPS